ncbi:MAG: hypothetical protein NC925_05180 [Candidatus Omnitrophica bacterium]|nr:hypothetical protein [Candidatus Omnitrophota bacterium]MCM8830745.1 hypothetical protein [Candidatus Omnitrophota bacterium]
MKPKFTPKITQIKLNPEQAVLICSCYSAGRVIANTGTRSSTRVCGRGTIRENPRYNTTTTSRSWS